MSDNNIKTKEAINANVTEKAGKPETVSDSNAELKLATAEYIMQAAADKNQSNSEPMLTVGYILRQIEKIQQDNEHIYKALETLSGIDSGQVPGDVAGEGKANGIADTVKCRETTNQKLIAFYEKLYDDLKQTPADPNRLPLIDLINAIERCDAGAMNPETSKEMKGLLIDRLKSDVGQKKTTKEMALDLVSQAFTRDFSDMDPEQIEAFSESISSVLDGVRHIDN